MRFWKFALAMLAMSLVARGAAAFTPESGLWWNPAEDGRGYTIEIQDNVLVILVYGYDTNGTSAFFLGAGSMVGNSSWSATLDGYTNGQCLTCVYQGRPTALVGAGGAASIIFDTETRARLTLGGRVIPIERHNFGLGNNTEKMLGEWQVVLDLSTRGTAFQAYPFYGDILTIDRVDLTPNPDQYRGCRPDTSVVGRCTTSANANHDVAGFFDTVQNKQVIVVTDGAGTSQSNSVFFAYVVTEGLSQFDGVMQIRIGSTPESPVRMYPVRGFRSASKRFVQTGSGPSSVDPGVKSLPASMARPGLVEALGGFDNLPDGLSTAEAKSQYGIDVEALEPQVRALIDSMR